MTGLAPGKQQLGLGSKRWLWGYGVGAVGVTVNVDIYSRLTTIVGRIMSNYQITGQAIYVYSIMYTVARVEADRYSHEGTEVA